MPIQQNPYPLRLEVTLSNKLKQLAKKNNRSYNKEIEFILKNFIVQYEQENGPIVLAED